MSGSINKVILIGNLGADPEIRSFPQGGQVCSLRVATSQTWSDKNTGERKERVEWHTISIFDEVAIRFAEQFLKKGSKVYCEGKLENRKWQDQTGLDRYVTEVVIRKSSGQLLGLSRVNEAQQDNNKEISNPKITLNPDDIPF